MAGPNSPVDEQIDLLTAVRSLRANNPSGAHAFAPDDFVCGPVRRSDQSLQRLVEAGARNFVAVIWPLSERWTDEQREGYYDAMATFAARLA